MPWLCSVWLPCTPPPLTLSRYACAAYWWCHWWCLTCIESCRTVTHPHSLFTSSAYTTAVLQCIINMHYLCDAYFCPHPYLHCPINTRSRSLVAPSRLCAQTPRSSLLMAPKSRPTAARKSTKTHSNASGGSTRLLALSPSSSSRSLPQRPATTLMSTMAPILGPLACCMPAGPLFQIPSRARRAT